MASSETLTATQLPAYFALMEVSSLLRHAVEQQLQRAGALSYVQFEILARLVDAPRGQLSMTDLADGVVYSRSGLTYQAGQLEKSELLTRSPSTDDERGVVVTVTQAGRALVNRVLPGHVELVRCLLFAPLDPQDVTELRRILSGVRDMMRTAPPRSAGRRAARPAAAADSSAAENP